MRGGEFRGNTRTATAAGVAPSVRDRTARLDTWTYYLCGIVILYTTDMCNNIIASSTVFIFVDSI